jgi:hypothetical protein
MPANTVKCERDHSAAAGVRKRMKVGEGRGCTNRFSVSAFESRSCAGAMEVFSYHKRGFLMNILLKSAVAGALALGATGAYAVGIPANGSSDLILIVENQTTFATYAVDTGISINSVLPTASLVSGAVLNTSLAGINQTVTASPTLQSFLAANPASADAWTLEAGQYNGAGGTATSNMFAAGAQKAIFTSDIGTATNSTVAGKNIATLTAFSNGLNASISQSNGGLFPLTTANETTAAAYTQDVAMPSANEKYGMVLADDLGVVGTSYQLFGFTGNNSKVSVVQSYILGSAILGADGTLTISGNSPAPVPLPAAVWLFGSGLMGLVGVSRRRKAAV